LKNAEFYGGFSQVYRPMIFKDIIPVSTFEKVDENIKDAKGYNAEIGFRGSRGFLKWDLTGFLLKYDNRFGTIALTDNNGNFYTLRTNIGNSMTKGLEVFVQGSWEFNHVTQVTVFTSTSVMDGKYTAGIIKSGNMNIKIDGNKIESVPNVICRNGITWQQRRLSISGLYSYTAESFADPLNTKIPNTSGSVGLVPAYGIFDLNASYKITDHIQIKAGINNLGNQRYFTKRPLFYPGPGIWPSDGRNAILTIIFKV
jgi:Fe(3+) dicitrate transport protein